MKTNTLDFDAQALRERILDLAMRGKLVSQDPNDEPASVLLEKIKADTASKLVAKKTKKIKIEKHSGEETLKYKIPNNWVWTKMGHLIYKLSDGAHKTPRYTLTGVPFLSVKDMSTGQINFENCKYISEEDHEILYKRCDPKKGDILLSKVGTTGVPALVDTERKFDLFVSVALLKFNHDYIDPLYLKYLIESPIVQIQAKRNTRGVGNKNWVLRDIAGTVVPLPPLSEQNRIAAKIAQLFDLLHKVETSTQQYAKLQTLLKSKVLDLAMRGKLVKQDPNDEPASVLLEKIKAEKAELVKEKKIKKSKPLPSITDEEKPFDIPDSWEWVRLGEYAEKITDQVASGSFAAIRENVKKYKHKEFALMVKTADFSNNFSKNLTYTDEHGYKFLSNSNLFGGELILSNIGSIGKCFVVPNLGMPMTLAPNSIMVKVAEESLKQFLYYFIQSSVGNAELWKITSGTTMKKFNKTGLKTIVVPIPPFAEQVRIINEIKKLYKLIK